MFEYSETIPPRAALFFGGMQYIIEYEAKFHMESGESSTKWCILTTRYSATCAALIIMIKYL